MDVCCNSSAMDAKGDLVVAAARHNRRHICKLQFLLRLGHGEYLLLPFVVGLLADSVFSTPVLYTQSAASAC